MMIYLLRACSLAVWWLLSLPRQFRDGFDIKILRRHLRQITLKDAGKLSSNVAIVATWARYPLRHSVQRLIDSLRAEGWSIILVLNESPDVDQVLEDWSVPADVVIRRANIGRDFGGYQCGYRFLVSRPEFSSVQRVAFFNDSVFYPPRFASILPEVLNRDESLSGFFINLKSHPHIQSFAVVLGPKVSTSSQVRDFWNSYYPTSIRRYAIRKGEIELSRQLIRMCPELAAVLTYDRLKSAQPDLWSNLPLAERQSLVASAAGREHRDLTRLRRGEISRLWREEFSRLWREEFSVTQLEGLARTALATRNASHALGLVATRVLSVPLKLDLLKRGTCTPADFEETLERIDVAPRERAEIMAMLLAQGTHASMSLVQREMSGAGFGS
jgi:hypothetical protein